MNKTAISILPENEKMTLRIPERRFPEVKRFGIENILKIYDREINFIQKYNTILRKFVIQRRLSNV